MLGAKPTRPWVEKSKVVYPESRVSMLLDSYAKETIHDLRNSSPAQVVSPVFRLRKLNAPMMARFDGKSLPIAMIPPTQSGEFTPVRPTESQKRSKMGFGLRHTQVEVILIHREALAVEDEVDVELRVARIREVLCKNSLVPAVNQKRSACSPGPYWGAGLDPLI